MASRPLLFGLSSALFLAVSPALADIAIPVRPAATGETGKAEEAALNAIACVADVLSFHTTDAKSACGRVIAAAPDEPLGYKFRGLAFLLEHDFEKAEEDFLAAVRRDPKDAENQAGYAQSLSGQGRYAAAIAGFDEALRLRPDDVRYLAARCWARMGDGKNLDLALADCNKASAMAPDFATARLNRGMVRLKQLNYRAAVQDFTRALDIASDLPSGLFGRGFAYLQLKDELRAEADIKAARRSDPSIDNLFIRAGILPATCRDASAPCPLPPALRNLAPGGVFMVSHQPSPPGERSNMEALDDTIRAIALDRLDRMLSAVAKRLHTSLGPDFATRLAPPDTADAAHHLMRAQQEYRRLQRIACQGLSPQERQCRAPNFQYTPMMRDDSQALRQEMDRTLDIVRIFWLEACRRPSPDAEQCTIY